MNSADQQFLKELDDKLWKAADRLRNNLDAANYKHVVLGLIFLKYVSDAFDERQGQLHTLFTEDTPLPNGEDNIYYMPREDYDCSGQVILATVLYSIQYFSSATFGAKPSLCR